MKLTLCLLALLACAPRAWAQTPAPTPAEADPSAAGGAAAEAAPTPAPALSETEAAQRRIARARALAAIGKLAAAAAELDALRSSTADESVRDVSRVILMSIYVEMPDYGRAAGLLDEAFGARAAGGAAAQSYFALAGQAVSAVRTHLERYRTFGLNVADADLPAEANSDLGQLRALLERVVKQAKAIDAEQPAGARDAARATDATALLEDAATVRLRVARQGQDRTTWQTEVSEARQRLFASETRIASLSEIPGARGGAAAPAAARPAGQPAAGQPAAKPSNVRASAPAAAPPSAPDAKSSDAAGTGRAAADAAGPGSPLAVGSLVSKARKRLAPSYPSVARLSRVAGVVTVFVVVNEKGDVEAVERADGPVPLQGAAVEAAKRWKFNPTVVNGQPVRMRGYLSFDFKP